MTSPGWKWLICNLAANSSQQRNDKIHSDLNRFIFIELLASDQQFLCIPSVHHYRLCKRTIGYLMRGTCTDAQIRTHACVWTHTDKDVLIKDPIATLTRDSSWSSSRNWGWVSTCIDRKTHVCVRTDTHTHLQNTTKRTCCHITLTASYNN